LSKPRASRGWVCTFYVVPLAVIGIALLVLFPGRRPNAAVTVSARSSAPLSQTLMPAARTRIQASYAALPLAFEQNQGQTDPQVKYLARGHGYTLFLTANDAVFSLHSRPVASGSFARQSPESELKNRAQRHQKDSAAVVHMHLVGGNLSAKVVGSGPMAGTANYFLGNDQSKWHSGVARYARVSYENVYPGVNMAFHGAQRELEFDFVLAPGANPAPIGIQFAGNQGIKTTHSGDLKISSAAGDILLHRPVAYQEQNGAKRQVDARFVLKAGHQVSFELGDYDRSRELVIDPTVSFAYSTYLGGLANDNGIGIAFDGGGNAYVTGETQSTNFPGASNVLTGTQDAFVTKIASDGSSLIYSTYVGGSLGVGTNPIIQSGNSIAVDASGDAFVAGGTTSSNFPASPGAFQTALKSAENAFVFELSPNGSTLIYSTYLGGTGAAGDVALGIVLDSSGNAYVVGTTSSTDFPTSASPLQPYLSGANNGFVTKLNPGGKGASDLVFSTYLGPGGGAGAGAKAVAVDSSGNVYVTGATSDATFHVTAGAYQTTCSSCSAGVFDAFLTVINPAGNAYVYSTFLGGSGADVGFGVAVDSSGNAYVTGSTSSSTDFPIKPALQTTYGGGSFDAFVTKINPAGTGLSDLIYSRYLGGSGSDAAAGIAVDKNANAYVTGQTASPNFPTASPTQASLAGGSGIDAFVSEINPAGSQLVFSTYLGGTATEDNLGLAGIAVDKNSTFIYVTGNTASLDFPHQSAYQPVSGGGTDAFVVKYAQGPAFVVGATTPTAVSPGASATSTVTLTALNGYASPVNLTCTVTGTGSPAPACSASSFSPASLTPLPSPGATSTLTITTTANHAENFVPRNVFYALWLPVGVSIFGMGFGSSRSQRKQLLGLLMLGMIMVALFLMPACGSSGKGGGGGGSGGTPAGAYTVTITGTGTDSAAITQTAPVTLTVN
jgi:Beta-propeller repeat